MQVDDSSNWDDGQDSQDGLGFRDGPEARIGGVVDMEDEVYLEFEKEEEVEQKPSEPKTWELLARYRANFKPNAYTMFTRFADEVWHLRTGIEYEEKGKNYYTITLFSKGDYDFVLRGGPWIFKQHALLLKEVDDKAQPSETILDSVPIWVRIYDVPWGKQNELWGRRYGNGLGTALEVDVPKDRKGKNEFLRVRVDLPYSRRLQTQITTGVKGKPHEVKVFKLKYERVPYYCSHCGFMGHKKDECEKERLGVPSLDYEAYELRCSPYKKYEHRAHFVPPPGQASARRGLSFASFGSAESRKSVPAHGSQKQSSGSKQPSHPAERVDSRTDSSDNEMPPLEDDPDLGDVGALDGFGEAEAPALQEVEHGLADNIQAMRMTENWEIQQQAASARQGSQPIIQFLEEEGSPTAMGNEEESDHQIHITMSTDFLSQLQRAQAQSQAQAGTSSMYGSWGHGPRSSDMIPALQGLSSLQASFGSVSDVAMTPADTVLGKRAAADQEVQGERLELSLGLDYGGQNTGVEPKKGKRQEVAKERAKEQADKRGVEMVYKRNKKVAATGHKHIGNLTRPNVWSRQAQ